MFHKYIKIALAGLVIAYAIYQFTEGYIGNDIFLILFSLAHTFNFASFVIEAFWLAISVIGLVRSLARKAK